MSPARTHRLVPYHMVFFFLVARLHMSIIHELKERIRNLGRKYSLLTKTNTTTSTPICYCYAKNEPL
jgi:hypothetical protein